MLDCGPAALKAVLSGFGIDVHYGRLRELCQTDVDGTSIDSLEDILIGFGLTAEQIMLPLDHLLLDEARAVPAIVVCRLPGGDAHFEVVWRRHGPFVQLMDPGQGRRWVRATEFLNECASFGFPVPAAQWRQWAASEEFVRPLQRRLRALGVRRESAARLMATAESDPAWGGFARLDAAIRLTVAFVGSTCVRAGREAADVIGRLVDAPDVAQIIPENLWTVRPDPSDPEQLVMQGGVIVRVGGRTQREETAARDTPAELARVVREKPPRAALRFFSILRQDGLRLPVLLGIAVCAAGAMVMLEALLLRTLLNLEWELGFWLERTAAVGALLAFQMLLLLTEACIETGTLKIGRRLECRFRTLFLEKLPRLPERYFGSRLISDLAERCHSTHQLRELPELAKHLVGACARLLFIVIGLCWLDPPSWPIVSALAASAVVVPALFQPVMLERDLRVRTYLGTLSKYYLDSLIGLTTVRCHGAERAVRREHESLVTQWTAGSFAMNRAVTLAELGAGLVGLTLVVWLVFDHAYREGASTAILLIVYWALQIPVLGEEISAFVKRYPGQRNVALRLTEPLVAPEDEIDVVGPRQDGTDRQRGIRIAFDAVHARVGGHAVLSGVDLTVVGGEHVAVVGPSGAGKSTLMGLLLGWHAPAGGRLEVDGRRLEGDVLARLREETAWVDPTVQLWNRSMLDNVAYGAAGMPKRGLADTIRIAGLDRVARQYPDGLQTSLGEGGGLLSGGEGQRVRVARALNRPDARLVILDEPFRGLDTQTGIDLLDAAREAWRDAVLFFVTHDMHLARRFERVIVLEHGRILEDDSPAGLLARPGSRFAELVAAQEGVHRKMWSAPGWRSLALGNGRLSEERPA